MGAIAIHGFGRIGRSMLKAATRDGLAVPEAISDVLDETMVSVAAWYDNEMGYATRLAEMAAQLAAA